MNPILFWVGQIGIILEIAGAGYIVFAAYKSKKSLQNKSHTIDAADVMESTLIEVRSQYEKEFWAFAFFGVGLIMQFLGVLAHNK